MISLKQFKSNKIKTNQLNSVIGGGYDVGTSYKLLGKKKSGNDRNKNGVTTYDYNSSSSSDSNPPKYGG